MSVLEEFVYRNAAVLIAKLGLFYLAKEDIDTYTIIFGIGIFQAFVFMVTHPGEDVYWKRFFSGIFRFFIAWNAGSAPAAVGHVTSNIYAKLFTLSSLNNFETNNEE